MKSLPALVNVMLTFLIVLLTVGTVGGEEVQLRRVMTWVPPYAVMSCEERLHESFDGVSPKDGLTHVALQFWNPTKDGRIELVKRFKRIDEAKITTLRKWGDAHGVRTMLCVYNCTASGWDWELAESAFQTNRKMFIDALVSETLRLKLDGVDVDFEGKGGRQTSREHFVQFIEDLSVRLHAQDKELSVNSFAGKWHAPNRTWWPALLPHVDGLQVMGYAETGADAEGWRSYEFLRSAAGKHSASLLIGLPANTSRWQGHPARYHLEWIAADKSVGLAIWDAQLEEPAWRTKQTWQLIREIKIAQKLTESAAGAEP